MNKKMHKLFVGLSVLFILALVVAMAPQPALAGGGGGNVCLTDGTAQDSVLFGWYVRDTFKTYHAYLPAGSRGIGSTVVMMQPSIDKVHIPLTIWVILAYNQPGDEYTVRAINVVTGCSG